MRISIEFTGDREDIISEVKELAHSRDRICCLYDIENFCRDQMKYNDEISDEAYDLMEQIRTIIFERGYLYDA